ncbi:MAG: DUF2887 domain-containing protein [Gomphosphaeria aponina SAG 52.96 = DSM 107014]|uniref:DUF2887 domain-containing protein n=1 Tax=Gomphosphaeria aponina SAG 52.96 = DSM 107014 TaxID=1521640 RepID=A0A941GPK0_9CHRO|nr:DUF2887 domain-containing protein [Gomphosphaeria aponina SAG 52.96 = DSM 107014]
MICLPREEANAYRFDSFEIKQTASRIDGLFVPLEENSNNISSHWKKSIKLISLYYSR